MFTWFLNVWYVDIWLQSVGYLYEYNTAGIEALVKPFQTDIDFTYTHKTLRSYYHISIFSWSYSTQQQVTWKMMRHNYRNCIIRITCPNKHSEVPKV